MQNLVNHILAYLEYLESVFQRNITIHEFQKITSPYLAQFLPYRVHSNPYCIYLKSHPEIWDDCIINQQKLFSLLENGPFWGVCHCGVTEYVYPLKQSLPEEKVIGFISVSGYRTCTETTAGKLRHICEKYDLNPYTVYLRCICRPICPIPPCSIPCFIHFPPCWKLFTKKNACSTGSPRRRHKTRIMFLTISFFLLRKIFTGRYPLRTSALPSIAAVPMSAIPSSLPPAAISGNILTSFESKRQKNFL